MRVCELCGVMFIWRHSTWTKLWRVRKRKMCRDPNSKCTPLTATFAFLVRVPQLPNNWYQLKTGNTESTTEIAAALASRTSQSFCNYRCYSETKTLHWATKVFLRQPRTSIDWIRAGHVTTEEGNQAVNAHQHVSCPLAASNDLLLHRTYFNSRSSCHCKWLMEYFQGYPKKLIQKYIW